jgi:hypothetical protein
VSRARHAAADTERVPRAFACLLSAAVALTLTPGAQAAPGLVVGFSDDVLKHEPVRASVAASGLGASAFRLTLRWARGQRELSARDRAELDRAVAATRGRFRVVLSVFGATARDAPQSDAERGDYCAYVREALARYPDVRDVVVWNEPNKQYFWQPQYSGDGASLAPAAYEGLLARCYDVLHAFRQDVNVITSTSSRGNDRPDAKSNVSHSPGRFVVGVGAAYRASGRTRPIFDTVGHHPYGEHSRERPWRSHPLSTTIGLGDWSKLVQAYFDGFDGTAQATPGRCVAGRCVPIWYMEMGFQTTVAPNVAWAYSGAENVTNVVPADGNGDPAGSAPDERSLAPDHATQLVDAIRLAYCQPYVEAYFNFMLRDEPNLVAWQSGLLWADWTAKPAWGPFAQVVAAARTHTIDCATVGAAAAGGSAHASPTAAQSSSFAPPRTDVRILRTAWPKTRRFFWRNDLWRFRIATAEDAQFDAAVVDARSGRRLLRVRGSLKTAHFPFVTFARRRLAFGRWYRMKIVVASAANASRTAELASRTFYVSPPRRRH